MESLLIHLLKSSALLAIFYLSYLMLLRKETTFRLNRKFLLAGLITSAVLPAIYFTRKVVIEAATPTAEFLPVSSDFVQAPVQTPTDWWQITGIIYLIFTGLFLLRLLIQLASVFKIVLFSDTKRREGFRFIETSKNQLPFSFFSFIVYNPEKHSPRDLELILEHEKVHARQFHSADILLINLFQCILWFNPFAWLYKKAVEENLEFIADQETVSGNSAIKEYQRTLVKVSIADLKPALTNHFYQSFIKKRILMLNKKSNQKDQIWKLGLIMPIIFGFMLLFNVKTEAQIVEKETDQEITGNGSIQDNSTSLTSTYSEIGKNPLYIINEEKHTAASLKGKHIAYSSAIPINGKEAIAMYGEEALNGVIIITEGKIIRDFNGELKQIDALGTSFKGKYIQVPEDGKPIFISVNSKDEDIDKSNLKKMDSRIFTFESPGDIPAANSKNSNIRISSSQGQPIYVLNEKVQDEDFDINSLDPGDIKKMNVLKGETATNEYGDKGKAGVIEIFTKDYKQAASIHNEANKKNPWSISDVHVTSVKFSTSEKEEIKNELDSLNKKPINAVQYGNDDSVRVYSRQEKPLYVLNGKVQAKGFTPDKINPENIAKINVIKGSEGLSKYGQKAENGVVEIFTNDYKGDTSSPVESNLYFINSKYTAAALEGIKERMKEKLGLEVEFSKIDRNTEGLITAIQISGKTKDGQSASATYQNAQGIPNIVIGLDKQENLIISINKIE